MATTKTFNTGFMIDKLRQYLPADQAAQELCLLTAWAVWYQREFGSIDTSAEGLRDSFAEAAVSLDTDLFSDTHLFAKLPLPLIDELIIDSKVLAEEAAKEPSGVALALIMQEHGANSRNTSVFIPELLGDLIADVIGRNTEKVELYHESSLVALCKLDNPKSATLNVMRITPLVMAVTSLLGCNCYQSDPAYLFAKSSDTADFLISIPPMGMKVETYQLRAGNEIEARMVRSDEGAFERAVAEVQHRGVLLLPRSALFSRSTMEARRSLVDKNWLHALVQIPERQLMNTMMPVVCLVINKDRKPGEPVEFIDVPKGEFSRFVEYSRIEEVMAHEFHLDAVSIEADYIKKQGYDLTFSRYKQSGLLSIMEDKKASSVTLDGVAEIIRAQTVKGEDASPDAVNVFREVSWRDISEAGSVSEPEKCIQLDEKATGRAEKQRLQPGDILLAVKGNLGNIALVPEGCGDNWIAGQAFVIIRPRQAIISSEFLYRYLSSSLIRAYLDTMATGTAMKVIKAGDLSNLPVELPTPEDKARVEANHRAIQEEYKAIQQHRAEIARLTGELWPVPV